MFKTKDGVTKVFNFISAGLIVILLLLQFVPFWNFLVPKDSFGDFLSQAESVNESTKALVESEVLLKDTDAYKALSSQANTLARYASSAAASGSALVSDEQVEAAELQQVSSATARVLSQARRVSTLVNGLQSAQTPLSETEAYQKLLKETEALSLMATTTAADGESASQHEIFENFVSSDSVSIGEFIWVAPQDENIRNMFASKLTAAGYEDTIVQDTLGAPGIYAIVIPHTLMLLLAFACLYFCLKKAGNGLVAIMPAVVGALGIYLFAACPVFRLGSGWGFQLILCSGALLCGVVAGVMSISAVNKKVSKLFVK